MTNISIQEQQQNITVSEPRSDYHLPVASETTLGGIKVGNNLTITEDGVLSAESTEYNLPTATASTLGGIKVGENLAINDGVLTADVDSVLNEQSTNPLENRVIASSLNSVDSTLSELDDRLDNIESDFSDLSNNVETNTSNISDNTDNISELQESVSQNTEDIATNAGAIEDNTTAISSLRDRMDTAESDISDLITGSSEISSDVNLLKLAVDRTVSYTSLLPAATWTAGNLILHRRGYLAFLFMNLEGNFLLGANSSTTIYTFQEQTNIPLYETSASVITDAGNIVLSVDDQGNVTLTNPTASALTITKIYGNVPLVY